MTIRPINAPGCPNNRTIELFLQGELEEQEALAFFNHLANCRSCENKIFCSNSKWTSADSLNQVFQEKIQTTSHHEIFDPLLEMGLTGKEQTIDALTTVIPSIPGMTGISLVGKGGMGVVYRAWEEDLKRPVAIKVLGLTRPMSAEKKARAASEAIAMARIIHDNVINIHRWGEWEGYPWFSMDWISGGNLGEWIKENRVNPWQAAEIVRDLARAVELVHQVGIIHCDLKPANILLHPAVKPKCLPFIPKISDFGLSSLCNEDTNDRIDSDIVYGTPGYMAPEQTGHNPLFATITTRTDIHGLGAILYELLTGCPPFEITTPWETLNRSATGDRTPILTCRSKLPKDLAAITEKALAHLPSHRYSSATELADDLDRFLEGYPVQARAIAVRQQAWKWVKRKPYLAGILAFSFLLLLTLASQEFFFQKHRQTLIQEKEKTEKKIADTRESAEVLKKMFLAQEEAIRQLVFRGRPLSQDTKNSLLSLRDKYLRWSAANDTIETHLECAVRIRGVGILFGNINELEEATTCQKLALKELDSAQPGKEDPLRKRWKLNHFQVIFLLGNYYFTLKRFQEAEDLMRQGIAELNADKEPALEDVIWLAICKEYLALNLFHLGKKEESVKWFREGIEDLNRLQTGNPDQREIWENLVYFLYNYAITLPSEQKFASYHDEIYGTLLCVAQDGAARFAKNARDFYLYEMRALSGLYDLALKNNERELALNYIDQKLRLFNRDLRNWPEDPRLTESYIETAVQYYFVLNYLHRPMEAEEVLTKAVKFAEKRFQNEPAIYDSSRTLINILVAVGDLLEIKGRRLEALSRFEQLESIARPWLKSEAVRGEIHYALSVALGEQSDLLSQLGKYELAVAKQEEKLQYDTADHRGANYLSLARKRLEAGDRKGAKEAALEAGKDPKLEGEAKEWIKNFLTNEKP